LVVVDRYSGNALHGKVVFVFAPEVSEVFAMNEANK
jgi:hypothetical protein